MKIKGLLSLVSLLLLQSMAFAQIEASVAADQQLWYGKMETPGRHFRFALKLTPTDAGSGTLISLDEGAQEFELSNVEVDDSALVFSLPQTKADYSAQAVDGSMVGKWRQSGQEFELVFDRVDELPKEELRAVWSGTINVLVQKVDIQIRELESGVVYLDSLTQKIGGFVAEKTVEGATVTLDVPALKASFTGELSDDGNEMNGTWKQGLFSPSLKLTRQADNQAVIAKTETPKRPQTPKGPFPYEIVEVSIENETAGVTLSGTLTIPNADAAAAKRPAVVLVSGSGPQDRDESIAGHKPFWVIADYFSRRGIAVLRYDDRGTAKSTGDFASATSVDLANDAHCAVKFLQGHEGIDAENVGIVGHSEGGLIAPMVAAKDDSIPFIVLMAGPGVNGEKILVSQAALIMRASGMEESDVERESAIQQGLIGLAKAEPRLSDRDFAAQAIDLIRSSTEDSLKPQEIAAAVQTAATQLRSPWFEYFMRYEPTESLEKLKCSVLAINGSKDLQVDAKLNLPAIESALEAAPTDDFETVELPGLNHLFQQASTGLMDEYSQIEETFDPSSLQLMTDWILQRVNR